MNDVPPDYDLCEQGAAVGEGKSAMSVSAHDVARELRRRLPNAGDVKIHKLLYYCQGWQLAWTGKPMFEEDVEAWANGPVVANLWRAERHGWEGPSEAELDEVSLGTVAYVVARYGALSGKQLIALTHGEAPWMEVSQRYEPGDWFNQEIGNDLMESFFADEDEQIALRALATAALDDDVIRDAVHYPVGPGKPDDPTEITRRLLSL